MCALIVRGKSFRAIVMTRVCGDGGGDCGGDGGGGGGSYSIVAILHHYCNCDGAYLFLYHCSASLFCNVTNCCILLFVP